MKSPTLLAALTLIVGLAVSALVGHSARRVEDRAIRERFQTEASGWRNAAAEQMDHFVAVLNSIRYLHNLSDRISASDFAEFVAKGMRYQQETLGIFGFTQNVPFESRATFDAEGPAPIVETGAAGRSQPAAARDEYFPILYMSPERSMALPPGFDLGAPEENRAAIQSLRANAVPALAGATPGPDGNPARFVFSPILLPVFDDQAKAYFLYLRGFAFALMQPSEILKRAIPSNVEERVSVELQPVAAPHRGASSPDERRPASGGYRGEPHFEDTVYVVNEPWSFRCAAKAGYLAAQRSRQPATLFAAGVAITALLAFQVFHLASRARRTELIVRERTAQLRDEMAGRRKLQEEILDISTREQQRLGRDLHDSLGQKLAGAVYLSKAVQQQGADDSLESTRKLNEVLKESVAQVRLIARGLSPVAVGDDGLSNALRRLADDSTEIFSVACSFRCEVPPALDAKQAAHVYQIAQEAVNNAIRHGQAREITVRLTATELVIEDNGKGFDVTAGARSGMGLQIMKYRAEIIDGELGVTSSPGSTLVICRFRPAN